MCVWHDMVWHVYTESYQMNFSGITGLHHINLKVIQNFLKTATGMKMGSMDTTRIYSEGGGGGIIKFAYKLTVTLSALKS